MHLPRTSDDAQRACQRHRGRRSLTRPSSRTQADAATTTATIEAPTTATVRTPAGRRLRRVDRRRGRARGVGAASPACCRPVPPRSSRRSARSSSTSSRPAPRTSWSPCSGRTTSSPSRSLVVRRRAGARGRSRLSRPAPVRDRGRSGSSPSGSSASSRPAIATRVGHDRRARARRIAVVAGLQVLSWLLQTARRTETADPRAGMPDWTRRTRSSPGRRSGSPRSPAGSWAGCSAARSSVAPPGGRRADPAGLRPRGRARRQAPTCRRRSPASRRSSCPTTASTGSTRRSSPRASTRATWTLRIHGLVDRETTLTWDELRRRCRCSSST